MVFGLIAIIVCLVVLYIAVAVIFAVYLTIRYPYVIGQAHNVRDAMFWLPFLIQKISDWAKP